MKTTKTTKTTIKTLKHGERVSIDGRAQTVFTHKGFCIEYPHLAGPMREGDKVAGFIAEATVIQSDRYTIARPQRIALKVGEKVKVEGVRGTFTVALPGWCEGDSCKLTK